VASIEEPCSKLLGTQGECFVKREDVQHKLEIIPENIEKIEILRAKDYREFCSDFRNVDSALHRLQTSIQALIDIGSYIIAELGLRTPSFSAEVIDILTEAGFIKPEDQVRYISMVQFRNRVVHVYNNIDLKVFHGILQQEIADIRRLYQTLLQIIEDHENKERGER
jgi:uncharacterized protein YutE (UPF0331/DUF86 family)